LATPPCTSRVIDPDIVVIGIGRFLYEWLGQLDTIDDYFVFALLKGGVNLCVTIHNHVRRQGNVELLATLVNVATVQEKVLTRDSVHLIGLSELDVRLAFIEGEASAVPGENAVANGPFLYRQVHENLLTENNHLKNGGGVR